jgi:hypothetical protein
VEELSKGMVQTADSCGESREDITERGGQIN